MNPSLETILNELRDSIKQRDWEMAKLKELEFYFVAARSTSWSFEEVRQALEKEL